MTQSVDSLIGQVRSRVQSLLHDEVIEHTIVVMQELASALTQLTRSMGSDGSDLTPAQKKDLEAILLPLTSESIREALHKGELPITNGIIRSKNRILTVLGVLIPESHREIDPRNYPNYMW